MKLVIRLLALLLLWLAYATSAHAGSVYGRQRPVRNDLPGSTPLVNGWTYASLVEWVGCKNVRFQVMETRQLNAWFTNTGWATLPATELPVTNVIGVTRALLELPVEQQFIVLLHETYHCIQDQRHELDPYGIDMDETVRIEQEADIMSAEYACRLGHDGLRYQRGFWETVGGLDDTNETHGSPRERMRITAARALSCRPRHEAPIA